MTQEKVTRVGVNQFDMVGVKIEHLAPIKKSTEKVGEITEKAGKELGLAAGTAVYGGGGDASLIGVGAGAVEIGDTHIYSGTSGWVGTVVPEQFVDAGAMMASIVGVNPETYNFFGELEVHERTFFQTTRHNYLFPSWRLRTIILLVCLL